jgi:hypothetical protein
MSIRNVTPSVNILQSMKNDRYNDNDKHLSFVRPINNNINTPYAKYNIEQSFDSRPSIETYKEYKYSPKRNPPYVGKNILMSHV